MDPLMPATEPSLQPEIVPPPVPTRRRVRLLLELIALLILMGAILGLASNKFQFEKVISASMEPTLLIGDVILTDANASPTRYDIVCLKNPEDNEEKLVKRVLGLPGDTIVIQDGVLSINGQEEFSEAITENKLDWGNLRIRVPQNNLYVMGDNRNNSYDSRNYGPVPYKNITGVVQLIVWPPKRWGHARKLH